MNLKSFGFLFAFAYSIYAFGQGKTYNTSSEQANHHQVKITSSAIIINGTTNINQFQCGMNQPSINDSIVVKNLWSNQKLDFEGLKLIYKIEDFECGIKAMDADFQELLKADTDPYLFLTLKSITLHQENDSFEELNVDAEVVILLAGVKQRIEITGGKVYNHSSAHLTLQGSKDLLMSDFNIEPPTRFFGVLKVTNEIKIEFTISMKVSSL